MDRESVATELGVLQSIYGDDAISVWRDNENGLIRYQVTLSLPSPHEDVQVTVLVSLLPSYPATSPPQLQLLSRYIGPFSADPGLFGSVLRTFISTNGVEWSPETVCVFDGLQSVIERCVDWYKDRLASEWTVNAELELPLHDDIPVIPELSKSSQVSPSPTLVPEGIEIFEGDPITDRKSVFVGRACKISLPTQVPLILSHLKSDRRIARAAHPVIHAWRCQVGTLLHQDNDDDGETAAGGRLAHLLQILEVNDVLVIVTRYFGGIHLGPDRFKHINQAARNALESGGFLDMVEVKKNVARSRGRKSQ